MGIGMFSVTTLTPEAMELVRGFEMLTMSDTFRSSKPQRLLIVTFRKLIFPETESELQEYFEAEVAA